MTTTSLTPGNLGDTTVIAIPAAGASPGGAKTSACEAPRASGERAPVAPLHKPDIPDLQSLMRQVVAQLEAYLQKSARNLEFSVDEASGRTVVTVRDRSSGEVIRQIPSEEALHIAQRLTAQSGTLLDTLV